MMKIDFPFLLGFDLSNANGYNDYCLFMDMLISGKVVYGMVERVLRSKPRLD